MATETKPEIVTSPEVQKETDAAQLEHVTDSEKGERSDNGVPNEKSETAQPQNWIPQNDDEYNVTFKTWIVVGILSWSYGVSFWIVPSLTAAGSVVATQLGDPSKVAYYVSIYLLTITIAFMICGGESSTIFAYI